LTPLETVARVKYIIVFLRLFSSYLLTLHRGHLYRHHRIFPCQRCKALFKDQEAVNSHLIQPKGCELKDIQHADGVTAETVEKLRSKKKAQQDQTDTERWKDIYKLLFPNEIVPSPCKSPLSPRLGQLNYSRASSL
jgi:ATP-dependent helicase/DNAse subunit B